MKMFLGAEMEAVIVRSHSMSRGPYRMATAKVRKSTKNLDDVHADTQIHTHRESKIEKEKITR